MASSDLAVTNPSRVALFRAVNVGGTGKVSMADLREFFRELGFAEPRTVLQTGNVVFETSGNRANLETTIGEAAQAKLGLKTEVHVRTAAEWAEVIAGNPFPEEARTDPSHLLVSFYREDVDVAAVRAVQENLSGPERLECRGRHLFVVYPDGIGTSTIVKTPGWRRLSSSGTARNWNTVSKIGELLQR